MQAGTIRRFNGHHKKGCGAKFSTLAMYCWEPARRADDPRLSSTFWRAVHGSGHEGRVFEEHCGYGLLYACACGAARVALPVVGKLNPSKKCSDKCQAATGHDCECACGGKNHGAAHAA